jgi:Porin subfamily
LTVVVAITIAATVVLRPSTANADDPVEYVKICSLYGAGFFYLPGTDTCVNFATNDARTQTAGGTWRWRVPNNPHVWAPSPELACEDGQLVKFGDITSSGLTLNAHSRYETNTHYPLGLTQGQYIASVMYQGGFTGVGVDGGNFCMFHYYNDPVTGPFYSFPLGCIDTAAQTNVPETLVFSPDSPIPPATVNQVYILGANGDFWHVPPTAQTQIQGTLSVWLCLKNLPGTGRGR